MVVVTCDICFCDEGEVEMLPNACGVCKGKFICKRCASTQFSFTMDFSLGPAELIERAYIDSITYTCPFCRTVHDGLHYELVHKAHQCFSVVTHGMVHLDALNATLYRVPVELGDDTTDVLCLGPVVRGDTLFLNIYRVTSGGALTYTRKARSFNVNLLEIN